MIQYPDECLLSAVCMLAGKDYAQARAEYFSRYDKTWWPDSETWWDYIDSLIPEFGQAMKKWRLHPCGASELEGKGIIIIIFADAQTTHALAFRNGLVYNPAFDEWATLSETLAKAPGWSVYKVMSCEVNETLPRRPGR